MLEVRRVGQLDVIGNAYEFLIKNFASTSGKKAGEFYTPPEVSLLMARLMDPQPGEDICDPTCGSGSLLMKCAQLIRSRTGRRHYALYGQEAIGSTWALAKMNMFLHAEDNHRVEWGDTLRNPKLLDADGRLRRFDVVVANPPFSLEKWGHEHAAKDPHQRFRRGVPPRTKGDYAFILHNFALHPGTRRPDPAVMQDFDLWTFNSKVFPAIEPIVARTGERVRIRVGNLSMWNHPIHLHGVQFEVTGSDGGRWPRGQWRREVTEIVGVGQMRDIEFTAVPGDWAFHCHMSHHTMGPMGHDLPNTQGVDQSGVEQKIRRMLPGYMAMGQHGMSEHQEHTDSGHMKGPENTLAMMAGKGPFGNIEMGGMFTVVKVRDDIAPGDFSDPGWYDNPPGTVARRVSNDPSFGAPVRRQNT